MFRFETCSAIEPYLKGKDGRTARGYRSSRFSAAWVRTPESGGPNQVDRAVEACSTMPHPIRLICIAYMPETSSARPGFTLVSSEYSVDTLCNGYSVQYHWDYLNHLYHLLKQIETKSLKSFDQLEKLGLFNIDSSSDFRLNLPMIKMLSQHCWPLFAVSKQLKQHCYVTKPVLMLSRTRGDIRAKCDCSTDCPNTAPFSRWKW